MYICFPDRLKPPAAAKPAASQRKRNLENMLPSSGILFTVSSDKGIHFTGKVNKNLADFLELALFLSPSVTRHSWQNYWISWI